MQISTSIIAPVNAGVGNCKISFANLRSIDAINFTSSEIALAYDNLTYIFSSELKDINDCGDDAAIFSWDEDDPDYGQGYVVHLDVCDIIYRSSSMYQSRFGPTELMAFPEVDIIHDFGINIIIDAKGQMQYLTTICIDVNKYMHVTLLHNGLFRISLCR